MARRDKIPNAVANKLTTKRFSSVLARRIFFGSLAILAVVLLGALLMHSYLFQMEVNRRSLEQTYSMVEELQPVFARSIWQINEDAIQVFLDTLVSNNAVYAATYSDNFLNLKAGDVEVFKNAAESCDEIITRDFAGYSIEGNQLEAGLLNICFQYPPPISRPTKFLTVNELPFLLAIMATSLIFVIFSWNLVIAPLRKLSNHIAEHKPIEDFKRDVFFGLDKEQDEIDILIGELTKRTQALNEERALINASFPEIVDAIVQTDSNHLIQRFNRAFEKLFEIDEEAIGFDLSKRIPKETLEDLNSRKEIFTMEDRVLEISTSRMVSQDETIGFLHVIRDLTMVKQLEDKAVHSKNLAALGTMSGGIAHDYKNLLATVLSNAEILRETTTLDEITRKSINAIMEASYRGTALSEQLLDFAQNRKPRLEYTKVDVVVKKLTDAIQPILPDGIEFLTDIQAKDYVYADSSALLNALQNLTMNAIDAIGSHEGKIRLSVKLAENNEREAVEFQVIDNGSGIKPEDIDKIREPFFTTKPKGKGAGLGLAMVSKFADLNNGRFEIKSELGHGTIASIFLPSVKQPRGKTDLTDVEGKADLKNAKILLIEHEMALTQVLSSFLKGEGYDVTEAFSLKEVKQQGLARMDFDLVICDAMLESDNVLDVHDLFTKHKNDTPFFVISGNIPENTARLIADIHPLGTLEKPFRANELIVEVRKALKISRRQKSYLS